MKPGSKTLLPAGARIRVLVVDDSVVIRRLVTQALEADKQIEVVGSASNGTIALQRIPQLNPHLVTLDIEMPGMDGIETVLQIRKLYPHIYVIMFSTLTERGATSTLDALRSGANDYITKASNATSLDQAAANLRAELVPKIKQFFQLEQIPAKTAILPEPPAKAFPLPAARPWQPRRILAIGVSTGGPNALAELIPMFPKNFALPILIVQHMPPLFTRLLAERLASKSNVRVEEATEESVVEPGKVLVAPGSYHMRVRRAGERVLVALDQGPQEHSCRPSVDVMFRSVAEVYGGGVIAAVLTGMGSDGVAGARGLRALGAYIIAQDENSSVVWGMPGGVVQAGLADAVVELSCIAPEILKQV